MMELHHIMMLIHHKLYDSYKLYYCPAAAAVAVAATVAAVAAVLVLSERTSGVSPVIFYLILNKEVHRFKDKTNICYIFPFFMNLSLCNF